MQVLLLTPEKDHRHELALVQHFFEQGLECLHLRKPGYTKEDYAVYLAHFDAEYHSRIVLHGHFELTETFGTGGIHLNTAMRNDAALMQEVSRYYRRSASFHSWDEIEENTVPYRYVFISPVFNSISKKGYKAGVDMAGAGVLREKKRAVQAYCPQLMALGGVTAGNLAQVAAAGFDGAVILGAVWQAPDPAAAFDAILSAADGLFRQ